MRWSSMPLPSPWPPEILEFANSAIDTIEGIHLIKLNLPGVLAIPGRLERVLWPGATGPTRLEFGHAVSLRPGRPGYGHH